MTTEALEGQSLEIIEGYSPTEIRNIENLAITFEYTLKRTSHKGNAIPVLNPNENIVGVGLAKIDKTKNNIPEELDRTAYFISIYKLNVARNDKEPLKQCMEKGEEIKYDSVDWYILDKKGHAFVLHNADQKKPVNELQNDNFGYVSFSEGDFEILNSVANSIAIKKPIKSRERSEIYRAPARLRHAT